ncbi:hypothetical protein [Chryseobacterium sp. MP_3.2]|uniref:hypothetical protein n=1 Tax=Chryseobacterium sp. MP_3.2 TaxID=3071712 RepID=UPI002DFB5F6C|nr:hypothetical protein [Chryseobacterium sp. MP_3.2]
MAENWIFKPPFSDFDFPVTRYTLIIFIESDVYTYKMQSCINKEWDVVLWKDISDQNEFIYETKALYNIFDLTLIYKEDIDQSILDLITK